MSTATLTSPARESVATTADLTRPSLGRLTRVELRKMLDTRAGFWLLVAVALLTVAAVVIVRLAGSEGDWDLRGLLSVAVAPATVLLPVVGILLVTSEWSQRTGQITFTLVPVRSRVLAAKLLASVAYALVVLVACLGVAAAGVVVIGSDGPGTWALGADWLGQTAVLLVTAMLGGVAFGAVLLASAPAIVVYFALPLAWSAVASLSFFADVAPWLDTARALAPLTEEILSATQWARAGTSLALWLLLPLAVGAWRITRREVSA